MAQGDFIVIKARPYESVTGFMYSVSDTPMYGVFLMKYYPVGANLEEIEKSFKITLVPALTYKYMFPQNSYYCSDIFNDYYKCYKEFESGKNIDEVIDFCNVQNARLNMIREIKENHNKCLYFNDISGDVHKFFYDTENKRYFETVNDKNVCDEDEIKYISEKEMEKIMFDLHYKNTTVKIGYTSFINKLFHLFN